MNSTKCHIDGKNAQQPKKSFWSNRFVEFCKRTDLHGFKYIVMDEFSKLERTCWAVAVFLSIVTAAYFVVTAYSWYVRHPIVTVIESTQGAIWDVPFPAVTICDLNAVSKKAAREFSNNLSLPVNVTADSIFKTLRLIPLLYSMFKASALEKAELYELQSVLEYNNITIEHLFKTVSPVISCAHLLQKCMWKNTIYRCDEIFSQIFTLFSVCCTFNYYAVDDKEMIEKSPRLPTPRRVASCGYQTALTVLMYSNLDDYYSATVASQGFLVIIDSAYNIPHLDSSIRMVNPSTEVLIALSPERTYATAGIKAFSPETRQCFYNDEVRIGHFRQYSFHNCMAYRKIGLLIDGCNCVPFFFPLRGEYRFCNFKDMDCMERVFFQEKMKNILNCLPECEHYDYPMEVALGKLADNLNMSGIPFFDGVTSTNRSLLNVFFNDLVSTMYRRDVYLNWQNILSAFGGLLSLMIGFTLISGLDLILFFVIRVGCSSTSWACNKDTAVRRKNIQEYYKKNNWTYNKKHQILLKQSLGLASSEESISKSGEEIHPKVLESPEDVQKYRSFTVIRSPLKLVNAEGPGYDFQLFIYPFDLSMMIGVIDKKKNKL